MLAGNAYDAFQAAPDGMASMIANDDYEAATDALVSAPCASRFGALALLGHLRWWLREEGEFRAAYQPGYGIAEARAADLTLFLGSNLPPVVIPRAFPSRRPPGLRPSLPLAVRVGRVLAAAGEILAAVAIIAGGCVLTGLATLL